jgi:CRISPR-associated endonuclease Csn1
MEKILGLDLGTNSIGWAIRNTTLDDTQFEKYGVITFETGVGKNDKGQYVVSHAAERTKKRSVRRLYQVRKYRLWETLGILREDYCPITEEELNQWRRYDKEKGYYRKYPVNAIAFEQWIKLDFNNDGKPDSYSSPYQIRLELATIKLDLTQKENRYKLGRALYHIAQHRGFKSSKKTNNNNEINEGQLVGAEKKRSSKITDLFAKHDVKTVGAAFAKEELEGIRIRENLHQWVLRKQLEEEVKIIFETQGISIEDEFYRQVKKAIFYQRPLRSQKGLVGICTLEQTSYEDKEGKTIVSGKPRCPLSHPDFEEFRALSFINNIQFKINENNEWVKLSSKNLKELRESIFQNLFFRKSKEYFKFSEIREYVENYYRKQGSNLELNYKNKTINYADTTSVSACPVSARLKATFGDNWKTITIEKEKRKGSKSGKDNYTIEDLWHILFTFDDEDYFEEFGEIRLKLTPSQLKEFRSAWDNLPVGYAALSLNAIKKILPFLQEGLIYTEAVLLANMPTVLGEKLWNENKQFLIDTIEDIISRNREEKRIINIVNNLIAKWYALDYQNKFGFKDTSYKLVASDNKDILNTCIESIGEKTWAAKNEEDKEDTIKKVEDKYQLFFQSDKKEFYKAPHLLDTVKEFLIEEFTGIIEQKKLNQLYHPSQIDIYPKAKPDKEGKILLGSPKTGAFKNPMAMRALFELKKLVNYLLAKGNIEQDTRIVVEVARELNDANKRWAIKTYQDQREKENKEFAEAIAELIIDPHFKGKANPNNESDIDKFRIWYEQINKVKIEKEEFELNYELRKEPKKLDTDSPIKRDWLNTSTNLYKLISAKDKAIDKYRLWKEQGCRCIYTGNIIKLTDLFADNIVDFEHTIPRSISFDNSLANLTVCFADYNRNIKKNKIPTQLNNYETDSDGYSSIKPRLGDWEKKVEIITENISFWKKKSAKAQDKDFKDKAVRQKHLWQFELDYWQNKLNRFTITEVTSTFKNSQLVDTQIISKYAQHYLKTVFNKVDVQKGIITAQFRKIYSIQPKEAKKDRSRHSHHAIDAAVLTLIPSPAKREDILKRVYELEEQYSKEKLNIKPYPAFKYNQIEQIEENILINNIAKDQALTPSKKIIRKRGKIVFIPGTQIPKVATGDSIRGQLHKESFYGAIKKVIRDENNILKKDEEGKYLFEKENSYVIREPLLYKKDATSPGFKNLKEIKDCIVDPYLFEIIKKQVGNKTLKDAIEDGIYMLNRKGEQVYKHKIRHIRIFASVSNPLEIKKQSHSSSKKLVHFEDREHKKWYYASTGEGANIICALYETKKSNKIHRSFDIINLKDASELIKLKHIDEKGKLEIFRLREDGTKEFPTSILKPNTRVIFYKSNIDEIKDLNNNDDRQKLISRVYKIIKFTGVQMTFESHIEARAASELKKIATNTKDASYHDGYSTIDFDNLKPRYRLTAGKFNFAIEERDFEILPDGEIIFK